MVNNTDPFFAEVLNRWQICRFCLHLHNLVSKLTCAAFPQGIPREITSGMLIHNQPLPGQKNGLIYQPR